MDSHRGRDCQFPCTRSYPQLLDRMATAMKGGHERGVSAPRRRNGWTICLSIYPASARLQATASAFDPHARDAPRRTRRPVFYVETRFGNTPPWSTRRDAHGPWRSSLEAVPVLRRSAAGGGSLNDGRVTARGREKEVAS